MFRQSTTFRANGELENVIKNAKVSILSISISGSRTAVFARAPLYAA